MSGSVSLKPRGQDFIRQAMARAAGQDLLSSGAIADERWGYHSTPSRILRAAFAAGSATPGESWGEELAVVNSAADEFFSLARQGSIIGKLAGLRETPLNVRAVSVTGGSTAFWVGAGRPKPVSQMALAGSELKPLKVAAMVIVTRELVAIGSPAAETRFKEDLTRACTELLDLSFIDPANAGVVDVSPASVTNGVTATASSGNPGEDIAQLIADFTGDLSAAYFVTDPVTAAGIGLSRDAGGSFQFVDVGVRGGSLLGIPLVVSRSSPRDSSGGQLVLLDTSAIVYGADGIRVERSTQSSIEMDDAPADAPSAGTTMVSLWQANLVALLAEISVNWSVQRAGSVSVISDALYATSAP